MQREKFKIPIRRIEDTTMINEKDLEIIKSDFERYCQKYNLNLSLDQQDEKLEVSAFIFAWIEQDNRIKSIKSKMHKLKVAKPTGKYTDSMLQEYSKMKDLIENLSELKEISSNDIRKKLKNEIKRFNKVFDETNR